MGICVLNSSPSLFDLSLSKPAYQKDQLKSKSPVVGVWKVSDDKLLSWPFRFSAFDGYISIWIFREDKQCHLDEKIPVECAESLFGAQFLNRRRCWQKIFQQMGTQYGVRISSYLGDSVEEASALRCKISYLMERLIRCFQICGTSISISFLNEGEPIKINEQLNEYVDLQSEQYEDLRQHQDLQELLFGKKGTLKDSFVQFAKILQEKQKGNPSSLPEYHIKVEANQRASRPFQKITEQSLPFDSEISQINIRKNNRPTQLKTEFEAGMDDSNLLLELGIEKARLDKVEEVMKGLFIATESIGKDYHRLNNLQIKLLVNCAASKCRNWFLNDFDYRWFFMADPSQGEVEIESLVYSISEILTKYSSDAANILIYCSGYDPEVKYSGSRSAGLLVGYLMCSLKMSYKQSLEIVAKKWPIELLPSIQQQLLDIDRRRNTKPKGYRVYVICPYSSENPSCVVSKYVCEVESTNNIQGIEDFSSNVFLCVGAKQSKIMIGRECPYKQLYEKQAKQALRLLAKYEGFVKEFSVENIEKTFRKQAPISVRKGLLNSINPEGKDKQPGYEKNEQLVLRYPILRPVWEKKKDDGFYFTVRELKGGAEVVMSKGTNWIGYEEDKVEFFDRVINCYLGHIPHERIWIMEAEEEPSLFDTSGIVI